MKKLNPYLQFVIGFFSIALLWGISGYYNTFSSMNTVHIWMLEHTLDENFKEFISLCVVPTIITIIVLVVLFAFTVLCKRKSMKVMYISALLATALPVLSVFLTAIFNDDGNIICWIYGFTIGLILHPFGTVLDGVACFSGIVLNNHIYNDTVAWFLVGAMIISLILYKVIKPKKSVEIYK